MAPIHVIVLWNKNEGGEEWRGEQILQKKFILEAGSRTYRIIRPPQRQRRDKHRPKGGIAADMVQFNLLKHINEEASYCPLLACDA
jgi:hypothetical protein